MIGSAFRAELSVDFVDFVGLMVKPATPFTRMPPFGWVRRRLNDQLSLAVIIPFPVTVTYARAYIPSV